MNNLESKKTKVNLRQYTMLIALVVIIIFFQIITGGRLLAPLNVNNLIAQYSHIIILAIGMLCCILTGGNIDLAVGSVVALIGACSGTFIITLGWNIYLSSFVCLLIGLLIGCWQGFWIAYARIPPFIVTLSGMLVFRGLTNIILQGLTLAPFPQEFLMFSTGIIPDVLGGAVLFGKNINLTCLVVGIILAIITDIVLFLGHNSRKKKGYETESTSALSLKMLILSAVVIWLFWTLSQHGGMRQNGIPTVLIIVGILLLVYNFITSNTVIGRHLYALGGNEKAARLSGVKTKQLMFLAYLNMSLLAAVAGLIVNARLNSASPLSGQGYELDAVGACFIGGASAYGGIGTIGGALIGALIMGILNNGMATLGVNANWQQVVKGLVLLAAVAFDVISKQNVLSLPEFMRKKKSTVTSV